MKELLYLCTKSVQFTFNDMFFSQTDGVAMGSPLGPVLANIFMVELERSSVPKMRKIMKFWYRYVDDTICLVKEGKLERILKKLNKFHKNIEFTYEEERNFMLAFLDVLLIRTSKGFDTAVYRKETNTDIYLHWESFAPIVWKKGTLTGLVKRAFTISSKDYLLEMELDYLRKVFIDINGYPKWFVYQTIETERKKKCNPVSDDQQSDADIDENSTKKLQICLPYQGGKGERVTRKMKNYLKNCLPNVETRVTFKGTRLSSNFSIKDKIQNQHKHNIVYEGQCPDCDANYIGETERRFIIRANEHAEKDVNSHLLRHSKQTGHSRVGMQNIKIIGSSYRNKFKRKLSEALFIKQKRPKLNVQEKSVPLLLFK